MVLKEQQSRIPQQSLHRKRPRDGHRTWGYPRLRVCRRTEISSAA